MKRLRIAVAGGLAAVFLLAGIALGQPRYGCRQRFNSLDANHDGKLTRAEFLAAPHWRANPGQMFDARDINKRGYLTVEDFCWGPGGRGMGRNISNSMGPGTSK